MKILLRLLLVMVAGVLAACASAAVTPTAPPAVGSTALAPDDTGSVQSAAPVMGLGGRLYPAQDLSIIAATGRPQFVNAYADW
jgi:hypothetical protein